MFRSIEQGIAVKRQHIGFGPMGSAPFYAMHNIHPDELENLCSGGVAIVNRTEKSIGSGQFHGLGIDSNSDPVDLMRFIPTSKPFLQTEEARNARKQLEKLATHEFCSFTILSRYYRETGKELAKYLEERGDGSTFIETNIHHIVFDEKSKMFTSVDTDGQQRIQSKEIVLATGGKERIHPDLDQFKSKILLSRDVLLLDKQKVRTKILEAKMKSKPLIVILGNGNSGIGALGELAKMEEVKGFSVVIAYRSKFYKHFESLDQARRNKYNPSADEVSNKSPFPVNRVRALRLAAQEILENAQAGSLGSIKFVKFNENLAECEFLHEAGLIIQAFGYHANSLTFVNTKGKILPLLNVDGLDVVDEHDQLLKIDGAPLEHAHRVGMGSLKPKGWEIPGFIAEAALTQGPVNGVKAYQGPGGSGEKLGIYLLP